MVSNIVVHNCDPCAGNCNVDYRNYFDINGNWLSLGGVIYAFFTDGIVTPAEANRCPASVPACIYSPSSAPAPTPNPNPIPDPGSILKYILAGLGIIIAFIVAYLLSVFG